MTGRLLRILPGIWIGPHGGILTPESTTTQTRFAALVRVAVDLGFRLDSITATEATLSRPREVREP